MSEVERASSTSRRQRPTVVRTRAKVAAPKLRPPAQEEVRWLLNSSTNRTTTPIRKSFVRSSDSVPTPPLARIVSTRGRGGGVALKVYLGLLRRSSAAPYTTNLSARRWAALLDLDDHAHLGARRVIDAFGRLKELQLIELEAQRGEASVITLLREDGSGEDYAPPSEYNRPGRSSPEHLYLQVPDALWNGTIQNMSAPALAMLLVLLAEPSSQSRGTWWSVINFPAWYGISASMRAKGTKELVDLGLLRVTKRKLDTPRGANADERDRVRSIYTLTGPANVAAVTTTPTLPRKRVRKKPSS